MPRSQTRQTLLDEFFDEKPSRGRRLNFLELPSPLRVRVYTDACYEEKPLACDKPLFSLAGRGVSKDRWNTCSSKAGEFQTGASLLLTCREIHDEMFKIVYSQNDFIVYGNKPAGLDVLRNLGPRNLAALTTLTVHLDMNRSVTPALCFHSGWGRSSCSRHHQELPSTSQQVNLQEWHELLFHIMPHLSRSNLCINLVCDLEGWDVALAKHIGRQLLLPLQGRLTLSGSSVRLGPSPSIELRSVAENVATKATGQPPRRRQRLGLLDLPHEVRIHILSYTDLVTKRKEVEWRPGSGYWTSDWGMCGDLWDESDPGMFFCRRAHASYTEGCRCWLAPIPLFLTCKTLSLEAEQVFFRQNRIVIKPSPGVNRLIEHTPAILDASHYLRKVIPVRALRHLRCLEIVFSPLKGAFLREFEPAYQDWLDMLDFVKDKLYCSTLTLRVCFSAWAPNHSSYGAMWGPEVSDDTTHEVLESYRRTLLPLAVLRACGLRHLQLDLASPFWLHLGGPNEGEKYRRRKEWAASTKAEIERRVMGNDYKSTVSDLSDSLWKLTWTNKVFGDGCTFDYDDPTMDMIASY